MTTVLDEVRRVDASARVLTQEQCAIVWPLISKIQRHHGLVECNDFFVATDVVWHGVQLTCYMAKDEDHPGLWLFGAYQEAQRLFELVWEDGEPDIVLIAHCIGQLPFLELH